MPMTLIQRQVLNSSQASVTFSNIPQNYQTLYFEISSRLDANVTATVLSFNTSNANFSGKSLNGDGSVAQSANRTNTYYVFTAPSGYTANNFSNTHMTIPNYSGSNNKAWSYEAVIENNATLAQQDLIASLWSNTSAITSITLTPSGANFVANSTFSLYGIS